MAMASAGSLASSVRAFFSGVPPGDRAPLVRFSCRFTKPPEMDIIKCRLKLCSGDSCRKGVCWDSTGVPGTFICSNTTKERKTKGGMETYTHKRKSHHQIQSGAQVGDKTRPARWAKDTIHGSLFNTGHNYSNDHLFCWWGTAGVG